MYDNLEENLYDRSQRCVGFKIPNSVTAVIGTMGVFEFDDNCPAKLSDDTIPGIELVKLLAMSGVETINIVVCCLNEDFNSLYKSLSLKINEITMMRPDAKISLYCLDRGNSTQNSALLQSLPNSEITIIDIDAFHPAFIAMTTSLKSVTAVLKSAVAQLKADRFVITSFMKFSGVSIFLIQNSSVSEKIKMVEAEIESMDLDDARSTSYKWIIPQLVYIVCSEHIDPSKDFKIARLEQIFFNGALQDAYGAIKQYGSDPDQDWIFNFDDVYRARVAAQPTSRLSGESLAEFSDDSRARLQILFFNVIQRKLRNSKYFKF